MSKIEKGLENIIALETKISCIDGVKGILKYRGYDISELVNYDYNTVSYLLIYGNLPNKNELEEYSKAIRSQREIGEGIISVLSVCNLNIEAMDALRTAVSYQSHCDPDLNNNSFEANIKKAKKLIAIFPTIVTAFHRKRIGKEPVSPDKELSHGANFLYMLRGRKPDEIEADIMEKDFILSAEHELNASTFSTRITASTLSDLHSSIISGLGTLKGQLHGGARMKIMNILDEIGSPDKAEEYVMNSISKKEKIMGFGHRVYKTIDPRAKIFKKLSKEIAEAKNDMKWYNIAQNMEKTVYREFIEKHNKKIYPNVDFYAAVVYKYLEIPPKLATSIFAIGRVSGWIAHIIEQYSDNRLIRPRAKYIGN